MPNFANTSGYNSGNTTISFSAITWPSNPPTWSKPTLLSTATGSTSALERSLDEALSLIDPPELRWLELLTALMLSGWMEFNSSCRRRFSCCPN